MVSSSEIVSSPSVLRNREPILNILRQYFLPGTKGRLFEVGSGTGEHAVFFADHFKDITWVVSDVLENHKILKSRIDNSGCINVQGPKLFKVGESDFPKIPLDYVFTANTLHIMSWKEDKTLLKLLGKRLREGALVFFYGPFKYNGQFTSESNAEFDEWLKGRNASSGVRNVEDIQNLMEKQGFKILKDHEMPANNRLLVYERLAHHCS